MKTLLTIATLGTAALGFAAAPIDPITDLFGDGCGPIEGTIAVANDDAITPGMARISSEEAQRIALRSMPGATFDEVDLDEEDGWLVYEVELLKAGEDYDVLVDAGTGRILCTETD
jgi:hypothetical protein